MECEYDCVICQAIPETPQPMVLLVMLCESGRKLSYKKLIIFGAVANYCYLPPTSDGAHAQLPEPSAFEWGANDVQSELFV